MVFWGTAPLFSKIGLEKIPPFPAMLMRNLILVVLALGSLVFSQQFRGYIIKAPKHSLFLVIAGALSGLIGQYTYFLALKDGQTSQVVPIVSAFPLMTAFISIMILNESLTAGKVIGIVMIVSGVFLLGR